MDGPPGAYDTQEDTYATGAMGVCLEDLLCRGFVNVEEALSYWPFPLSKFSWALMVAKHFVLNRALWDQMGPEARCHGCVSGRFVM